MVITTTAVAFILTSLGLAFCGLRFFRVFQKIDERRPGSRIGFLLSSHLISSAFVLGILGLGSLIFARNPDALYYILLISHLPLIISSSIGVYLIYYIFFARISPWPAIAAVILLGITIIISTAIAHPLPFLGTSGGIDWNMSWWLSVLLSFLVFLQISSTFYIFYKLFSIVSSRKLKNFSLFIAGFSFLALVNHLVRFTFFVIDSPDLRTRIYDLVLAFIGALYVIVFLVSPFITTLISKIRQTRDSLPDIEK